MARTKQTARKSAGHNGKKSKKQKRQEADMLATSKSSATNPQTEMLATPTTPAIKPPSDMQATLNSSAAKPSSDNNVTGKIKLGGFDSKKDRERKRMRAAAPSPESPEDPLSLKAFQTPTASKIKKESVTEEDNAVEQQPPAAPHSTTQAQAEPIEISSDESSDSEIIERPATPLTALEKALDEPEESSSPQPPPKKVKLDSCIKSEDTPSGESKKKVHFDESSFIDLVDDSDDAPDADNTGEKETAEHSVIKPPHDRPSWSILSSDQLSKGQRKRMRRAERKAQLANAQPGHANAPSGLTNNPKAKKQLRREAQAALTAQQSQHPMPLRSYDKLENIRPEVQHEMETIHMSKTLKELVKEKINETHDVEAAEAALRAAMVYLEARKQSDPKFRKGKKQNNEKNYGPMTEREVETKRQIEELNSADAEEEMAPLSRKEQREIDREVEEFQREKAVAHQKAPVQENADTQEQPAVQEQIVVQKPAPLSKEEQKVKNQRMGKSQKQASQQKKQQKRKEKAAAENPGQEAQDKAARKAAKRARRACTQKDELREKQRIDKWLSERGHKRGREDDSDGEGDSDEMKIKKEVLIKTEPDVEEPKRKKKKLKGKVIIKQEPEHSD